jgi:hypothetical protein
VFSFALAADNASLFRGDYVFYFVQASIPSHGSTCFVVAAEA